VQVRAPTRPHPEAANLAPFNEVAFAAAKQVDVALDQVRGNQHSVVPASSCCCVWCLLTKLFTWHDSAQQVI
jgi:hypothetical protein